MRKAILIPIFLYSCAGIFSQPCTPDPSLTYPDGWGIIPDANVVLPEATVGEFYTQTFYAHAPKEHGDIDPDCFGTCGWDIDFVSLDNIYGLPQGLSYECNPPSCQWPGDADGCVVVSGVPLFPTFGSEGNNVTLALSGTISNWTGSHEGSFNMTGYNVIVNPIPCDLSISIQGTNETISGAYDGQAIVNVTGSDAPFTYEWSSGATNNQIIGLTAGLYSVTVTDNIGCEAIDQINIESDSIDQGNVCATYTLALNVLNESLTGAMDGSITATIQNGTPPYSYQWSNGIIDPSIENLSFGSYALTVTDQNGCIDSAAAIVALDSVVPPDTNAANNPCVDFSLSLTSLVNESVSNAADGSIEIALNQGNPPFNISWSNAATSALNEMLSPGEYWVFVQDDSGCFVTDTFEIMTIDTSTVACALNIYFTKTNQSDVGLNDGIAAASTTGGQPPYTYEWSNGNSGIEISGLSPGVYVVTSTDQLGCVQTDSVKIFAFGDSSCVLNVSQSVIPESSVGSQDGIASVLVNGGVPPYEYVWSNGEYTSTIYNLSTDNYFVTVSDASLCSATEVINVPMGAIGFSKSPFKKLYQIHPNPTKDVVEIVFEKPLEGVNTMTLSIMDMLGKTYMASIKQAKFKENIIQLSLKEMGLTPGMYMLSLKNLDGEISEKIIYKP